MTTEHKPHAPLRALILVRLSRLTDESTSPERQRLECERLCQERGWEVVGVAEDLDVSAGKTSPFERPALSRWLDNPQDFDVLVFFRLDRLVRSVRHLWDVISWSEDHGVTLVSATERHFDLSDKFGRLIVALVATVAELELDAISERNASAFQHNYSAGKWTGGVPPWGYLPEQTEDGWRLVQDPQTVPVIRAVVERVLGGEPLRAIAHDLTERRVLTAKDRFAQHQGRQPKGYGWHSGGLKRALSSPTLLGYATTGQGTEVVRGEDGTPLVRAEPILSRSVYDRVQVELQDRENRKEPTVRSSALLLRVIYCGVCGRPAYRLKGGAGRTPRYRCSSAQYKDTCGNRSIPLPEADALVESALLWLLGASERLERVWDAGEDHSEELADVNARLVDLTGVIGTGAYRAGTPQRERLDATIRELAERQERLSSLASRPSGWTWEPTGERFSDWWEDQTTEERNVYLRTMGVTLGFTYSPDPEYKTPTLHLDLGNLGTALDRVRPEGAAETLRTVFGAMTDHGVRGAVIRDGEVTVHR